MGGAGAGGVEPVEATKLEVVELLSEKLAGEEWLAAEEEEEEEEEGY